MILFLIDEGNTAESVISREMLLVAALPLRVLVVMTADKWLRGADVMRRRIGFSFWSPVPRTTPGS